MKKIFLVFAFAPFLLSSQAIMFMPDTFSLWNVDSVEVWLDARYGVLDSVGLPISENDGVGTWLDNGPNNRDFTQATAAARPLYKATSGAGGGPGIKFDGLSDFLSSVSYDSYGDDISIFAVVSFSDSLRNANECIIGKWATSGDMRQWLLYGNTSTRGYRLQMNRSNDGLNAQWAYNNSVKKHLAHKLFYFSDSGLASDVDIYMNLISYEPSYATPAIGMYNANSQISVGAWNVPDAPTAFFSGIISFVSCVSRDLTPQERTQVIRWIVDEIGL